MLCYSCITCLADYLTLTAPPWLQQRNERPAKNRLAVVSQLLYLLSLSKMARLPEQAHITNCISHDDVQDRAQPSGGLMMDGTWSFGNRLSDCMGVPTGCEPACSQQ